MSPTRPTRRADWKPDDKPIEGRTGGQRIRAALKKYRIPVDRVITSRDPGMDQIRYELRREDSPPGIQSWMLPFVLEGDSVVTFLTVAQPGAVVPIHSHKRDLFRVVVSGSIITNGIELKSGDWMFVPKGASYGYSAGLNPGAVIYHCYG